MKKQFVGLALMAIFSVSFAQQATALNIPKGMQFLAKTTVVYQQANNSYGHFEIYKAESGQLMGLASHNFRTKVADKVIGKDDWRWASVKGEIIDGRNDGDKFTITVHYFGIPGHFPEGNYRYDGTVSPGGLAEGEVYSTFTPQNRVKWNLRDSMRWIEMRTKEEAPPAAPPPEKRVIKSTGKGKSNATYTAVPAGPNPAPWVNYAGVWELYSGPKKYLMDLTQEGNRVEGTYKQLQGEGTADAKVSGTIDSFGVLTFTYQQKGIPLCMGTGIFKTALDSKSFEGSFKHSFPSNLSGQTGTWSGKKITEGAVKTQTIQSPVPQVFPPQNPALGANDPVFIANEKLKAANKVFGGTWFLTTNSGTSSLCR